MAEPSKEQWLELHSTFREYCAAEPWRWLDDAVLVLEHPIWHERGYCVALGCSGLEFGLAVYIGDEGLRHYLRISQAGDNIDSPDLLDTMNSVSALLADRGQLDTYDLNIIKELGLRYRGRKCWPAFRSMRPGYAPWRLEADEAAFLTIALQEMMGLAARVEEGQSPLFDEDSPGLPLIRSFDGEDWQDKREPVSVDAFEPVPEFADTERLRRLADAKSLAGNTFEFSVFYLHTPVSESRGERPYFLAQAMIADQNSGYTLPQILGGPTPSAAKCQEALVSLLEALPFLPADLVVDKPEVASLAAQITEFLGITLYVGETPDIWEFREMLEGFGR